jgi:hypothetical protein
MFKLTSAAILAAAAVATSASADVVTQWNFNSAVGDATTSTGTLLPSTGSGSVSLLGGITNTFAAGGTGTTAPSNSSDPNNTDDSGLNTTNYQANPPTGPVSSVEVRGPRFDVSTASFENIIISFDWRTSNTSSDLLRVDYTTDGGTTWTLGSSIANSTGGDQWNQGITVDLSSVVAANNNAGFGFRIVPVVADADSRFTAANPASTYAAGGTWRFDMVTINGTVIPTPGAFVLAGLGGLVATRRRRA